MPEETTAERIAREAKERKARESLPGDNNSDVNALMRDPKNAADAERASLEGRAPTTGTVTGQTTRSAADLGDKDKGTKEPERLPASPAAKVDVAPTLVADGSRSPHDATSDGGNKQ